MRLLITKSEYDRRMDAFLKEFQQSYDEGYAQARLLEFQSKLDNLADIAQDNPSWGKDYYKLYEAQAAIHLLSADYSNALRFIDEAIRLKGSSYADGRRLREKILEKKSAQTGINSLDENIPSGRLPKTFLRITSWLFIVAGILVFAFAGDTYENGTTTHGVLLISSILFVLYASLVLRFLKNKNGNIVRFVLVIASLALTCLAAINFVTSGMDYVDNGIDLTRLTIITLASMLHVAYAGSVIRLATKSRPQGKGSNDTLSQNIHWKYLPLVLAIITLASLPSILTRHNIRQAAQDIINQSSSSNEGGGLDELTTKYALPGTGTTINFPEYPRVTNRVMDDGGVQVKTSSIVASNAQGDTTYIVQVRKYPEYTKFMADNQREILTNIMDDISQRYSATVISPGHNRQYLCGHSARKQHFTFVSNGETIKGNALAVLDYNTFYTLINYGKNAATFNNFVDSYAPEGGCKYDTSL